MAAEYTYPLAQTVQPGQHAIFNDSIPCPYGYVYHRNGSGLFTLRNIPWKCFTRYSIQVVGNMAVAEGGTPGETSVGIAINGESLPSAVAMATPVAVGDFYNFTCLATIDVPRGCCLNVALENLTADIPVTIQNAVVKISA